MKIDDSILTGEASLTFTVRKRTFSTKYGECVEWTLYVGDGPLKTVLDTTDGFKYGHYPKGYSNDQYGPLETPLWDKAGRVHDWRNYVDSDVRNRWAELDDVSRMLHIWTWDKEARLEEWD